MYNNELYVHSTRENTCAPAVPTDKTNAAGSRENTDDITHGIRNPKLALHPIDVRDIFYRPPVGATELPGSVVHIETVQYIHFLVAQNK